MTWRVQCWELAGIKENSAGQFEAWRMELTSKTAVRKVSRIDWSSWLATICRCVVNAFWKYDLAASRSIGSLGQRVDRSIAERAHNAVLTTGAEKATSGKSNSHISVQGIGKECVADGTALIGESVFVVSVVHKLHMATRSECGLTNWWNDLSSAFQVYLLDCPKDEAGEWSPSKDVQMQYLIYRYILLQERYVFGIAYMQVSVRHT